MPKVYVSGYAWIDVTDYDLRRIAALKAALTIHPRRTSKHQTEVQLEPIELFQQKENLIGVPREYFMKNRTMEHEPVYRVTPGRKWATKYESAFTLRDDQPEAVEAVMLRMTEPFGGAIVQAPTGWGKTVFAVEVARKLGVFTAVLVDKEKLRDQWIERIKSQLPGIRVGVLQENRCDLDADVIVCMLPSMTSRDHDALYEQVGLVIADEVHHMGARTRIPIIARFTGAWRLGLSAKPHRIDGCERAFYDNIGPKTYVASIRRATARVFVRKTYWRPITTNQFNPEKVSDNVILNIMCADKIRNEIIVSDLIRAVTAGRKCIVFSERRKHLDKLRDIFAPRRPTGKTDGFLRGGMTKEDLRRTDRCDVLWATYNFAKEAYDNPDIDTVLLATPVGDPEQPVGRGTRWKPDKKETFVLDYLDSGPSLLEKRFERRKTVYRSIKATIGND